MTRIAKGATPEQIAADLAVARSAMRELAEQTYVADPIVRAARTASLEPELELELLAIRKDARELGVTLWLDGECKLHAKTTRGPLPAGLRERIATHKVRLALELLVAESYRWRLSAWSLDELTEIRGNEPGDLIDRRITHLLEAMEAVAAGDLERGRAALAGLRTCWRAAARHVLGEDGDRPVPDDFPNHPPKEK